MSEPAPYRYANRGYLFRSRAANINSDIVKFADMSCQDLSTSTVLHF